MSTLTDKIASVLESKNLSIYKLEQLAGLKKDTMKKWDSSLPSYNKVLSVANALDVSVDYLLGNSDNPQSHKNESAEVPFASELSNVVANLETSAAQTEAHIHRIKSILQVSGMDVPDPKSNDTE